MIDTPVFGFFHRARPAPTRLTQPTHAVEHPADGRQADGHEASAPASDPISPRYDQAPAPDLEQLPHAAPAPIHQLALPPTQASACASVPPQRFAAPVFAEVFAEAFAGTFANGSVAATSLGADQLGLAHPLVITLIARLGSAEPHELDAGASGIYRPTGFRAAPWSGFACDAADDARIGLAAGTRILTARGEVEVERLLPGDAALALRGPALLPIAWIGRTVMAEHSVCIDAGALGPNLPRRTLCVAAGQPIFLESMPVAARTLLNGSTIRPAGREGIDMFQIDVGRSEILFAEGLPLSSGERAQRQRSAPPALS